MINYEHERVSNALQRDSIIDNLVRENENLKRMLLIEHDSMGNIEERIKELEKKEQEKALELKKRRDELKSDPVELEEEMPEEV